MLSPFHGGVGSVQAGDKTQLDWVDPVEKGLVNIDES
jgi:hypothetical protein